MSCDGSMESTMVWTLSIELDPSQVNVFQAIFEAHEGLGTVRTIDKDRALISVYVPEGQMKDSYDLLESLQPPHEGSPICITIPHTIIESKKYDHSNTSKI